MKKISALRSLLLMCVLLVLSAVQARASHIIGFDFNYTWISGNTYKITMVAYGDCSPASAAAYSTLPFSSPHICIYDGNTYVDSVSLAIDTAQSNIEVTPLYPLDSLGSQCTNTASVVPGFKKFTYTATYTLPHPSATWRFLYIGYNGAGSVSGRVAAFTNIAVGTTVQLVDTLNNLAGPNSSPHLNVIPTPYFCLNTASYHTPGAIDPDGDSLVFTLVSGMNGPGTLACTEGGPISYIPPSTADTPIQTSPGNFTFDGQTGQINFIPNILQRDLVVYNIEEHRAGVLVGTSQREMTIYTTTCLASSPIARFSSGTGGSLTHATDLEICSTAGPFSATIVPTEDDTTNNIKVTVTGLPAGATFTTLNDSTNHPTCTFNWSTTGITPGYYVFYATFTDDHRPVMGQQTIAFKIVILPTNGCGVLEFADNVNAADRAMAVYPNPSSGRFTLQIPRIAGSAVITVTDIIGKVVRTQTTTAPISDLDLCNAPAGNYLIKVVTGDKIFREKITVTK